MDMPQGFVPVRHFESTENLVPVPYHRNDTFLLFSSCLRPPTL